MLKHILTNLLFLLISIFSFAQINTFPWSEDFESVTIPVEWTQEYISAAVDWTTNSGGAYSFPESSYSGTKNAHFFSGNFEQDQTMLISPQFDITGLNNPLLSFWHAQVPFDTDQDKLYVYYKTSEEGEWVLLASYTSPVETWTQRLIVLPETSDDFYIGFSAKSGYGFGVCLDLVGISDSETCIVPENVIITQTTNSYAIIDWIPGGSESQWQIEYGLEGFTQGGGAIVNASYSNYTLTDLIASMDYEFYIRSYCNPLHSEWIGPFSFSTNCNIVDVFPYNESFEFTTVPAPCWSVEYSNPSPPPGNLITHSTQQAIAGERSIKFCSFNMGAPYDQYLISREFDFSQEMQVNFRYRKNITGNERFCIGTSSTNDNISSFTWQADVTDASSSEWKYFAADIPAYTKYVAIHYKSVYQNSLYVDDLNIRPTTDCYEPIDFLASDITPYTAVLSWTPLNGEVAWIIEYGPVGFELGTEDNYTTDLNPFTMTNLQPDTEYDVYIISVCGATQSPYATKTSFTTPVACPMITEVDIVTTNNTSVGLEWTETGAVFYEIQYGLTGFSLGTGTSVSSITTNSKTITGLTTNTAYDFYVRAYCGSLYGYSEWIGPIYRKTFPCPNGCYYTFTLNDYFGDGWGNVSISVYQNSILTDILTLAEGGSEDFEVVICSGATVKFVYNQGYNSDECAFSVYNAYDVLIHQQNYGSLEFLADQTVLKEFIGTCVMPTCYPPINMECSQLSYNKCLLNWEPGNEETVWKLEYGLAGFMPGSGTFINNITTVPYLLSGLTPSTSYDIYLYSDCGGAGISQPTVPISITTYATPAELNVCNLNIAIPDNSFTMVNFDVTGLNPVNEYTQIGLSSVSFIIEHPYDGDIDMYLESPEGIQVTLIQDVGGIGDNFGDVSGSCSFKTILSINPVNGPILGGVPPFNGNYSAIGNLTDFNTGAELNGLWKLKIADDNNLYTGKLQYFNLTFFETKALVILDTTFYENTINDGSISNTANIVLYNETFSHTGMLNQGTDFTITNLPDGLNITINVISPAVAQIVLSGNAINHIADINNLILSFNNVAFTGGNIYEITGTEFVFKIDFFAMTNITNDNIPESAICAGNNFPYYMPYSVINSGEATLPQGTELVIWVEYPVGTPAFEESLFLESVLEVGDTISGVCTNPLYFENAGEHTVLTDITTDGDFIAIDNYIELVFNAVTHNVSFPQAINDTIIATEFPYEIYTTATFDPPEYTQILYYFWNGVQGAFWTDVLEEGWIYLNTESSYCYISDSVYIGLISKHHTNTINDIYIYPNPTKEKIYYSSTNNDILRIKICDIDGRVYNEITDIKHSDKNELDVSLLRPGMYLIIMETKNGNYNKTFIKI
ncbi:MAG TPA: fibronectin type III domain-containing protein [Bacteroidales bacterium]|nr:fibronectin type III domain-containing protein [Bacteroidales bacterium]